MVELEGSILSGLIIKQNYYESLYVGYPPEGHTYLHDILYYVDGVAKLAVNMAIP